MEGHPSHTVTDAYRFPFTLDGATCRISVRHAGQTLTVLIDAEDLPKLRGYGVGISRGYVRAYWIGEPPKRLHRLVTDAPPGTEVDHHKRDKLDNRKGELTVCAGSVNRGRGWGDGYGWDKKRELWRVQIWWDHRPNVFGWWPDEATAKRVAGEVRGQLVAGVPVASVKAKLKAQRNGTAEAVPSVSGGGETLAVQVRGGQMMRLVRPCRGSRPFQQVVLFAVISAAMSSVGATAGCRRIDRTGAAKTNGQDTMVSQHEQFTLFSYAPRPNEWRYVLRSGEWDSPSDMPPLEFQRQSLTLVELRSMLSRRRGAVPGKVAWKWAPTGPLSWMAKLEYPPAELRSEVIDMFHTHNLDVVVGNDINPSNLGAAIGWR